MYVLFSGFSPGVARDVLHRAGAEQGEQRDHVVEGFRAELPYGPVHARGFQLEEPHRLRGRDQGDRIFVLVGDLPVIEGDPALEADVLKASVDDGQVS